MAKKKPKKSSRGTTFLWKALFLLLGLGFVSLFTLIALVQKGVFGRLPGTAELAELRNQEATLVLSSQGAVIGKIYAQDRISVLRKDIPAHVVDALVSTEDQRFFRHQGVDGLSYLRVFFRTILGRDRSGGGGSTLSQQLVKNLYGRERHGLLTVPVNKVKEALVALRLESVYDKEELIALYLNSVPFGENIYGIEAAAERYFSKPARKLRTEEGAVLVGMLKANSAYNPRLRPEAAKARRNQVLALMAGNGKLKQADKDSLQQLPLRVQYKGVTAFDAYGYFNTMVERQARGILKTAAKAGRPLNLETDGLRVYTTLDTALQQAALRSAGKHMASMQALLNKELAARKARQAWEKQLSAKAGPAWRANANAVRDVFRWNDAPPATMSYRDSLWHYHSMLQAAFIMAEPATGKVRAYSGGNDFRFLPYDQVQGRRPLASVVKPVIYAAALERGLQPCTYLNNERRTYDRYDGWSPQNFDKDTIGGEVAMWYALAHSMNIPTVDLYFRTGVDTIRQVFAALGLPSNGTDKPALALGAVDVSLAEVAKAYSALAWHGLVRDLQLIERITDAKGQVIWQYKAAPAKRAVSEETAQAVTAMLRRAVDSGTGASLRSRWGVRAGMAGKTGTSQDYSDAWFVAYTPGLVAATWVGARDPAVHFNSANGTGARLALPIIGGTLAQVERSPEMRRKYLLPMQAAGEVDMECPPFRQESLIERLFDGVFGDRRKEEPARKEEKKDGLFRRLFPSRR